MIATSPSSTDYSTVFAWWRPCVPSTDRWFDQTASRLHGSAVFAWFAYCINKWKWAHDSRDRCLGYLQAKADSDPAIPNYILKKTS